MDLYIYKYNNYYNRIVKKEETLLDYGPYIHVINGCKDFSPNDGVNTQHIFGSAANNYDGSGDYIIVTKDDEIVSRWFILETKFTRSGQWLITMHRDLMADYYADIINAPCFIEKATLSADDPLIFNSEQMTVNQIKKSETLLKDKSNCPWIVGYYAKNAATDNLHGTTLTNPLDDSYDIFIDVPFADWEYNATQTAYKITPSSYEYCIYGMKMTASVGFQSQQGYIRINKDGQYLDWSYVANLNTPYNFAFKGPIFAEEIAKDIAANKDSLYEQALSYAPAATETQTNYFLNLQNKIVKDSTGAYYQITIEPKEVITTFTNVSAGSLFNDLAAIVADQGITGTPNSTSFKIRKTEQTYKMNAVEVKGLETIWDMRGEKLNTADAPYNIFAIPLGEVDLKVSPSDDVIATSNAEIGMATANAIIREMDENLYDIQLLPYCPFTLDEEGVVNVLNAKAYSLITSGEGQNVEGFILNVPNARFSKNIYLENPIIINNTKIENECDMYKLCSPNWASEFQFSAAKNGGIQFFNIDCEYKPFQPYIHVNPNFGKLYGKDFDDARGLILAGDFSLAQIRDQWETYQTQNKNFQLMFDRQIQNMEVQNNMGRIQDIVGAVAGTATGAASGALISQLTNIPGLGIAGGVVSGAAGIADIAINEALRNEALDYTKDNFGYQLGNIQALPYTLTKVSAFNNNNKIFPVLEYYSCTDREKEALANKVAWNGMTVMAIGYISDYIDNSWSYGNITSKNYIKGKIIRIDTLEDEYHLLVNIAEEINKGVYF